MNKVLDNSVPEPNTGCFIWMGPLTSRGYGNTRYQGKTHLAHRLVLTLDGIEIPAGAEVDHKCFNRWCVNPSHLEPVTPAVNSQRAGKRRRGEFCRRGHPLADAYTYPKRGTRMCRQCHADRERNRRLLRSRA